MFKTMTSKVVIVMVLFILALVVVITSAFIAIDTQDQHIMLTELLTKQELFVERVTFKTIAIASIAMVDEEEFEKRVLNNKSEILDEIKEVDLMLSYFEKRIFISPTGKIRPLKFRKSFLLLLDSAVSETKLEWMTARAKVEYLLDSKNIEDYYEYKSVLEEFQSSNKALMKNASYITKLCRDEAERRKNNSYKIEMGSVIISIFIFIYWRIYFGKNFYKPIKEIRRVFQKMGKGQIDHYLERQEEDEFKELYNDFNYFIENLKFLFKLEDQILLENNLNRILEFIYADFNEFIDFERLGIVFKDQSGKIKKRILESNSISEYAVKEEEFIIVKKIKNFNGRILTPLIIGEVYLGYVYFECDSGTMDETDINFLNLIQNKISLAFYKSFLFTDLLGIITESLANMAESRDPETGLHLERMSAYSQVIARRLFDKGLFKEEINLQFIKEIKICAPMHDIGKVHIPDEILLKPGKLTELEFEVMKTHAAAGGEILEQIHMRFKDFGINYFKMASEIAYGHQEKYDGSGYPRGISGDDIPLCARITAAADVFDALTSKRPYKDAFSLEKSYKIMEESSGSHFDSEIVKAFFESKEEIELIYKLNKEKEL